MFESLPGFREFYPEACTQRNYLFLKWRETARKFGFQEYDAPILEPLDLFTKKSGEEIVSQLFNFTDKGEREVALRPEMTPSLARMVGAKANSLKKPIKWYTIAENFRYEKPQKGRLRSHYQLNCDILGEQDPGADAEVIATLLETLRSLKLTPDDIVLRLSDRQVWMSWLRQQGLDEIKCLQVLNIIDKMEREKEEVTLGKLKVVFGGYRAREVYEEIKHITSPDGVNRILAFSEGSQHLTDWSELHMRLDALGYGDYIKDDFGIVRGLAYYTGFVYEVFERKGDGTTGRAIAGGGRYDELLEKLGYPSLPACGFGMGDVVLSDLLEEKGLLPNFIEKPDVYIVMENYLSVHEERPKAVALKYATILRSEGFRVEYTFKEPINFGKQFKQANQSGAPVAVIFGADEVSQGYCKVKDLVEGTEKTVDLQRLTETLRDLNEG